MGNLTKEYRDKYCHALDRMYDLFKFGRTRETELEKELNLARDKFIIIRIKALSHNSEITGLCVRAINSIDDVICRGQQPSEENQDEPQV